MNKKMVFYEVNPKYFKDYSGDGHGDLRGLSNKMDYFKYLGVDALILPNILSAYSDDAIQDYTKIAKSYGTISDLQRAISIAKTNKIKIIVELNIGSIKETHKWFKNALEENVSFEEIVDFKNNKEENINKEEKYKYTNKTKSYYVINEKTQEVSLNWANEETMRKFIEVVKFWNDLGVNGFTFTNFEQINYRGTEGEIMSSDTLKTLRQLYISIKEINDNIMIIGKSNVLNYKDAKRFTLGATKVFDYTKLTTTSMLGTSKQYGNDQVGRFSQFALAKDLKASVGSNNNIVSFGSDKTGRITSRWGDEGQYNAESAKALGMLLLTTSSSSSIFYADELGAKNIGLNHLDDFQDATLHERKRALSDKKIKETKFMDAQVLQNPINTKSLMAWNKEKNGGFSHNEKTITPVSSSYKQINVELQYNDKTSPLNFYKKLINLSRTSTFKDVFNFGSYKISNQFGAGVIHVIRKFKDKEIHIMVNLSNKPKYIIPPKMGGKVHLSTYGYKTYPELPKLLDQFEGILITKDTDEFIKQQKTQIIEAAKLEQAKTREIELLEKAKNKELQIKIKDQQKIEKQKELDKKKAQEIKLKEKEQKKKLLIKEKLLAAKEEEKARKAQQKAADAKAKKLEKELVEKTREKERNMHHDQLQKKRHEELKNIQKFIDQEEVKKEKEHKLAIERKKESLKDKEIAKKLKESEKKHLEQSKILSKEKKEKELGKTKTFSFKNPLKNFIDNTKSNFENKNKDSIKEDKESQKTKTFSFKNPFKSDGDNKEKEIVKEDKESQKTKTFSFKNPFKSGDNKEKEIVKEDKESQKTKTFSFKNPFKKTIENERKNSIPTKTIETPKEEKLSDEEIKELEDFLK